MLVGAGDGSLLAAEATTKHYADEQVEVLCNVTVAGYTMRLENSLPRADYHTSQKNVTIIPGYRKVRMSDMFTIASSETKSTTDTSS